MKFFQRHNIEGPWYPKGPKFFEIINIFLISDKIQDDGRNSVNYIFTEALYPGFIISIEFKLCSKLLYL